MDRTDRAARSHARGGLQKLEPRRRGLNFFAQLSIQGHMAISRPLLLVLVGALALLAVTTGMRVLGGGGAEAPSASPAASSSAGGAQAATMPAADSKARPPARRAAVKEAKKAAKADDPQSRVLRAIAARKVVVLFFGQTRSADDKVTRRAVKALGRDGDGVRVFTASINDISDYARVVSTLGIEQSPSTVVIDRAGKARLVQGFLDAGSLRQLVADARS